MLKILINSTLKILNKFLAQFIFFEILHNKIKANSYKITIVLFLMIYNRKKITAWA